MGSKLLAALFSLALAGCSGIPITCQCECPQCGDATIAEPSQTVSPQNVQSASTSRITTPYGAATTQTAPTPTAPRSISNSETRRLVRSSPSRTITSTLAPSTGASASSNITGTNAPNMPDNPVSGRINDASANGGILQAHNAVRARKGVPPLTWSADLAKYAQEWADYKARTTCSSGHRPYSGQYAQKHGENLFFASGIRSSSAPTRVREVTAEEVVEAWASEEQWYNYNSNTCSGVCGHYTQIVWKDTSEVGCARATCGDQSQFWVCNYDPAGNYSGQRPY